MEQAERERWNNRYQQADTPWDSGVPSAQLVAALDGGLVAPCRALELGCGTGTNAIYLAQRGFDVTAVDAAPLAIETARRKTTEAGVGVMFLEADAARLGDAVSGTFDFVFDRGCYHCVRRENAAGFVASLVSVTHPGSLYLLLAGNADEVREHGPPGVTREEIERELGPYFAIESMTAFRFHDSSGGEGPLGWSCVLRRR